MHLVDVYMIFTASTYILVDKNTHNIQRTICLYYFKALNITETLVLKMQYLASNNLHTQPGFKHSSASEIINGS